MIQKVKHKPLRERYGLEKKTMPFKYVKKVLIVAGYRYREKSDDYIRIEDQGRFHFVKSTNKINVWNLHYDTYGEECDHYCIPMPYKVTKELNRIGMVGKRLKEKYIKHD